jgi:hypothetical protein
MKRTFKQMISILAAVSTNSAIASSHREAPTIAEDAPADITDLYVFRAPGNEANATTFVMNVYPAQVAASGPNWYRFGDDVRYEFNIDTTGDAVADLKYRFEFKTSITGELPLAYLSPGFANLNFANGRYSNGLTQNYTMSRVTRSAQGEASSAIIDGAGAPVAPARVGPKTTDFADPNTDIAYRKLIAPAMISKNGYRVFAGPRNDPFYVDLGAAFDTLNIRKPAADALKGLNVLSIVVEIPNTEIFGDSGKKIMGVWATTSRPQNTFIRAGAGVTPRVASGGYVQVARLGNPLVNELVIGLKDKDLFNASQPKDDAQFANYVLAPALPVAMNALFAGAGLKTVRAKDRTDLAVVFALGVPGINRISDNGPIADMLRINVGAATGFPNGRGLKDDIVDVALKVVAECSTKALGLPANLPSSQNFPLTTVNCQLSDNVAGDDLTKGGSGIMLGGQADFPYVGIPHSGFENPTP